jgi:hypothetical protein
VQRGSSKAACLAVLALALQAMPAAGQEPEARPHVTPTFNGQKGSIHAPDKPPPAAPVPDARELYERALSCWPAPTYMRADVAIEGRLRSDTASTLDSSGTFTTAGRASAALVARIPLYSAAELDREREREFSRRTKAADAVGDLVAALADRHRMRRELDIMRALERRAQERIKIGVAETAEQIKYLEKVADLESDLLKQRGTIEKARLVLLAMCTKATADQVDDYLAQYIKAGQ